MLDYGVVGKKRQNMVIRNREFEYTTVWQWDSLISVVIWSLLGFSHVGWAFVYYNYYSNSIIDLISFGFNAVLFSQNLIVFLLTIRNLDSADVRGRYWYSTLFTALGPWIIWPITLIANIAHATLYRNSVTSYQEFEDDGTYIGVNYSWIVVKNLLFFIYNLIIVFISFETFFPIYEWWQTLANLAVKVPYNRPTAAEVESNDCLLMV